MPFSPLDIPSDISIISEDVFSYFKDVKSLFSEDEALYYTPLTLPDEFARAWMHWLLSMVRWEPTTTAYVNHCVECVNLISSGVSKLERNLPITRLAEKEAAMPLGIMSLVIRRVLEDFTHPHPDVITSYWDYFNQLSRDIEEDPYNRAHQRSISFLRQEVDAITRVLNEQIQILENFKSGLETRLDYSPNPINLDGERVEDRVVYNCLASVGGKLNSFQDMRNQLDSLQIWNIQMIDSNKDRQETALYVFTIVTVIFLPLSFVSGFLGMNTSDIRDMSSKQWLFWAIGIPLTSVIIIVGLLWVGHAAPAEQRDSYLAPAAQAYAMDTPPKGPLIQRHAHPLPRHGTYRDSAQVPGRAWTVHRQPTYGRPFDLEKYP
ncbi:hypothetical protein H2201_000611 [Coniosporium apollinis]|uniref:Magnesium transporter n=1 Tax=Coniosporium apollinis TaxID=61459 RepID=A0ABQ9P6P6_9PEZI|nr:hypothetical protein H2201_000611 [Coniosporium apollinis]